MVDPDDRDLGPRRDRDPLDRRADAVEVPQVDFARSLVADRESCLLLAPPSTRFCDHRDELTRVHA